MMCTATDKSTNEHLDELTFLAGTVTNTCKRSPKSVKARLGIAFIECLGRYFCRVDLFLMHTVLNFRNGMFYSRINDK